MRAHRFRFKKWLQQAICLAKVASIVLTIATQRSMLQTALNPPKMAHIHVRVKDDLKQKAKEVLDEIGMDMSTAINLYLKQIVITKGIPFRLRIRSKKTTQGKTMSSEYILAYLDSLE